MGKKKKKQEQEQEKRHGRFHSCIDAMFPSRSQVNDAAAAWRKGHAMIARLAHELLLRAHRWRPAVVGGRARAGRHPEVLLLVHLPQPLDLLLERLLMSVLEKLVLRQSRDPLLEVAVADGEDRPLLIQEGHPRRQHGHLVLQRCDAPLELGDVLQLPHPRSLSRLAVSQYPLDPLGVADRLRGRGRRGLPRPTRLLRVSIVVLPVVVPLLAVAVAGAVLRPGGRRPALRCGPTRRRSSASTPATSSSPRTRSPPPTPPPPPTFFRACSTRPTPAQPPPLPGTSPSAIASSSTTPPTPWRPPDSSSSHRPSGRSIWGRHSAATSASTTAPAWKPGKS